MSDSQEEEFVMEEEELEGLSAQAGQALKKLREKLKESNKEKQGYLESLQRERADFANYKRQEATFQREKDEQSKAELIEVLLPVLDALELSLRHEKSPTLEMLQKQFLSALKQMGVEQFGSIGEVFSPHKHEALAQKGDGTTIESLERSGYSIGEKIIRPAQVII